MLKLILGLSVLTLAGRTSLARAEQFNRGELAAPIEITHFTFGDPESAPWAHVKFRGPSDRLAWLRVEGAPAGERLENLTVNFIPDHAVIFHFYYRGREGYAEVPTPGVKDLGHDQSRLILFTLSREGLIESLSIREVHLRRPGPIARAKTRVAAAMTWFEPTCERRLAPRWPVELRLEHHEFETSGAR